MHPELFRIPYLNIPVRGYGLMMALGFLGALLWIRHQSKREGISPEKMTDFAFWLLLVAVAGSRIASVLIEGSADRTNPLAYFKVWDGGLVFYGGLIACLLYAWYFLKKHKYSFLKVYDIFMPGVALGLAIGRIGCFLAGCCHGQVCPTGKWYSWMSISFPQGVGSHAHPLGVPLFATQLFSFVFGVLLFIFLAWRSKKKAFDGQILSLYLMVYPVGRFLIELLRGDEERQFVPYTPFSTSQFISIILFIIGAGIYILFRKDGRSQ